jgi:methionine-rich copper-binding protein CopC
MEKIIALLGLCLLAAPLFLQAHPKLLETTPAADSIVGSAAGVSLSFNQDVRLLKLSVTSENGVELDSDFKITPESKKDYSIAVDNMVKGKFTVTAAIVGADGHTVSRSFSFTVE